MIDERTQEILTERLVNRIEKLNEEILVVIGRRLKQIGNLNVSQIYQIRQMLLYGEDLNKIVKKIAEISELNIKDIYKIFEEEAKVNQSFAKQFYKAKGIDFIPYAQNIPLQNQVRALATITAQKIANINNLSNIGYLVIDKNGNEVFKNVTEAYSTIIDNAIINITQGKMTFNEELRKIVNTAGKGGLRTIAYESQYVGADGQLHYRTRRLDSAVRMNMLDGIRTLTNEIQQQFGKEFGADGIEISVHENPAVDHAPIQGHQFSIEEYNNMQSTMPFKDYQGRNYEPIERHISEYNCYHYTFPILLGISKQMRSDKELKEILDNNEKGFEFEGKHYTNYEGTQLQRKIETEIRKWKDLQIFGKASGNKEVVGNAQSKITQLTNKYKKLSQISGLKTKMDRMRVSGYKRININKM